MSGLHTDRKWAGFDILVVSPTPTHPQDQGNRKRMFRLCCELKRQGARVHFLHYAADLDWRWSRPARAEAEMAAAWDSYELVLGSDQVHAPAADLDHLIDEWRDPALLHHLRWTFRVRTIDAVIVAYTWMSYCFEAVPAGIYRICDTHDRFSGRRHLLEENSIAAEFFHTMPNEEARGLARADLVWAIKRSEQRFFEERLSLGNCMTLPHSEPDRNLWVEPPSADRWLRVGLIGALNNINRRNLESFLQIALPILVSRMAPVKLVIAGGCAEYFRDLRHPNIVNAGRVRDVGEFYAGVDVVCAPMQFSTGLKIKVAEALAAGVPLLSHHHAMDGYPASEPHHLLPDFRAIAMELVRLAFNPALLMPLARASRLLNRRAQQTYLEALEETRERVCKAGAGGICILAPLECFDTRTLLHDHLRAAIDGLGAGAPVNVFLTGAPGLFDAAAMAGCRWPTRFFVEPVLHAALGPAAPDSWTALNLSECLHSRRISALYCLTDNASLALPLPGLLRTVIVRYDALKLSGGCPEAMVDRLVPDVGVVAVATRTSALGPSRQRLAAIRSLPFGCRAPFASLDVRAGSQPSWSGMLVLASTGEPLLPALRELGERLGVHAEVIDVLDSRTARLLCTGDDALGLASDIAGACVIIDLTQHSDIAGIISEGALRRRIPVVRLVRGRSATVPRSGAVDAFPTSDGALFAATAQAIVDQRQRSGILAQHGPEIAQWLHGEQGWRELRDLVGLPARDVHA